jgi:hypothetical protein
MRCRLPDLSSFLLGSASMTQCKIDDVICKWHLSYFYEDVEKCKKFKKIITCRLCFSYMLRTLWDHDQRGIMQRHTSTANSVKNMILILILINLLTAIGFTPGGSSTVHIYTQTTRITTQLTTRTTINNRTT